MKLKFILLISIFLLINNCAGVSSSGVFGTGVSIAFDPRSVGTQIDDSIMQKNLSARILLLDKDIFYQLTQKFLMEEYLLLEKSIMQRKNFKLPRWLGKLKGLDQ